MLPASISSNALLASTKARRQSRFMLTIRVRQIQIRFGSYWTQSRISSYKFICGNAAFCNWTRPIQSGNKSRAMPLSWQDPEVTKMEMPQRPYIFNVYPLILTPAYNPLFLVPTSRIPSLSSSCSIYFGTAYYPLHSRANFTLSAWIVMQALSSRQWHYLFTYIHCPAFHYDPLTSLPCGKLNSSSGWGIPRHASRITLNSSRLMLAEAHPHTRPLRALLYVLSMSLCRSRVRLLAVTGCLFFLR